MPSSALLHVDLYESDHRRCCIALSPSKGLTKSGVVLLLAPPGCFCGRVFFLQSQASYVTYLGSNSELRFIQRQCQELGLGCALKREPRGFAFLFSDTFWQERLSDGVPHDPLRGYFVARFDSACPLDSRWIQQYQSRTFALQINGRLEALDRGSVEHLAQSEAQPRTRAQNTRSDLEPVLNPHVRALK